VAGKIDWETQIGRRLRLRDLHVFFTVIQRGSMAKAAAQLGVSQPAVSEVIAGLEHTIGVRLFDRGPDGVAPTIYGHALLKRGSAAFDELRQGIKDIQFLADPTVGELRIGCAESLAGAVLVPIIQKFSEQYPGVTIHVVDVSTPTLELPQLRERNLDLALARIIQPIADGNDDLKLEILFDDEVALATGMHSRWASRRKVDIAELVHEPWILTPPNTWNNMIVAEAFGARGLAMPKICLMTYSVHLRINLLASGSFVSAFPLSILRTKIDRFPIKMLPVDLPYHPWPVALITLKNRTLSPLAERFIDHVRAFTSSMTAGQKPNERLRKVPIASRRMSS
jgi:DNA-binding transcriptional LysR family regulator